MILKRVIAGDMRYVVVRGRRGYIRGHRKWIRVCGWYNRCSLHGEDDIYQVFVTLFHCE